MQLTKAAYTKAASTKAGPFLCAPPKRGRFSLQLTKAAFTKAALISKPTKAAYTKAGPLLCAPPKRPIPKRPPKRPTPKRPTPRRGRFYVHHQSGAASICTLPNWGRFSVQLTKAAYTKAGPLLCAPPRRTSTKAALISKPTKAVTPKRPTPKRGRFSKHTKAHPHQSTLRSSASPNCESFACAKARGSRITLALSLQRHGSSGTTPRHHVLYVSRKARWRSWRGL